MLKVKRFPQRLKETLNAPDILPGLSRPLSKVLLIVLIGYIILWQYHLGFLQAHDQDFDRYAIFNSCGTAADPEHRFAYGLYYWSLFPVFFDRESLPERFSDDAVFFSQQGAQQILNQYGQRLRMDNGGTFRSSYTLALWLPYFYALVKGTARGISNIPANAAYFTFALIMLLLRFWHQGKGLLGLLLVLFVGSYPFQIVSVYAQDNIFSYMISTVILALAICAPFIFDQKITLKSQINLSCICAILVALAYTIRSDCLSALPPCLMVVLTYTHTRSRTKLLLAMVITGSFLITTNSLQAFFDYKFAQASKVVKEKGGQPLVGPRRRHHVFWHTIWCGMEDFDTKYKHFWNDSIAEARVKPVLRNKYGLKIGPTYLYNRPQDLYLSNFIPQYEPAMRDLIISEIKADIPWYLGILGQRLKAILCYPLAPRITLTSKTIIFPYHITVLILTGIILFWFKSWGYLKLIFFSSATASIPFLVTTMAHYHYYSIIHLFLTAIAFYFLIKFTTFLVTQKQWAITRILRFR